MLMSRIPPANSEESLGEPGIFSELVAAVKVVNGAVHGEAWYTFSPFHDELITQKLRAQHPD
jgi:hypothetical protein